MIRRRTIVPWDSLPENDFAATLMNKREREPETAMKWNYRVVRRMVDGCERRAIHRAFYIGDQQLQPHSIDDMPVMVDSENLPELLERMSAALSFPVLDYGSLPELGAPQEFIEAEERRLWQGLSRKAQGMELMLEELRANSQDDSPSWAEDGAPAPDGCYIGFLRKTPGRSFEISFPDLPGCMAEGHSLEHASHMASGALADHLAELRREGQPIPPPSPAQALAYSPERNGASLLPVEVESSAESP